MMRARQVAIEASPLEVARRISDRPGFAFLWSAAGGGPSYAGCDPLESTSSLDPESELPLAVTDDPRVTAPRWVGVVPYEAMRYLERPRCGGPREDRAEPVGIRPVWLRYGAVACITDRVLVVGDDRASVDRLALLLERPPAVGRGMVEVAARQEDPLEHAVRIERALELIRAGELYQVNLARRLDVLVRGRAVEVLAKLSASAPAPYAAAIDTGQYRLASTSPELLVRLGPDGSLRTSPIKGTRPRGVDARSDRALARELDADPKERAELTMILDVERNDLGRIAETGSVRLRRPPEVVTHRTVHHREATLSARLRAGSCRGDVIEAMVPSGSVTGAPKIRAMEAISVLEPHRRGVYTGAIGCISHDGGLTLSMAIRVLVFRSEVGHYYAGGGIVADSDPGREVEETAWKAVQVAGRAEHKALESFNLRRFEFGQNLAGSGPRR